MSTKTVEDIYPTRHSHTFSLSERKDPVVYENTLGLDTVSPENSKFFEKNGYLIIPNLFSPIEVSEFVDELERMAKDEDTKKQEQVILEPYSGEVRSIFEIHKNSKIFKQLSRDPRIVNVIRQLLGSDVYITQSRINRKPGFEGKEFFWHSDFETWHAEDGMPRMKAISCSISLTNNYEYNGPLMVIPGSHKSFLSCAGETPEEHYKMSLKKQEIGTPDKKSLEKMAKDGGIETNKGPAGSVIFFDCNIMHGSGGNITPFPRSNTFFVYNSVHNKLETPFAAKKPRPEYIASRTVETIQPESLGIEKNIYSN